LRRTGDKATSVKSVRIPAWRTGRSNRPSGPPVRRTSARAGPDRARSTAEVHDRVHQFDATGSIGIPAAVHGPHGKLSGEIPRTPMTRTSPSGLPRVPMRPARRSDGTASAAVTRPHAAFRGSGLRTKPAPTRHRSCRTPSRSSTCCSRAGAARPPPPACRVVHEPRRQCFHRLDEHERCRSHATFPAATGRRSVELKLKGCWWLIFRRRNVGRARRDSHHSRGAEEVPPCRRNRLRRRWVMGLYRPASASDPGRQFARARPCPCSSR